MPENRPAPAPLPRPVPGDQSAVRSPVPLPAPTAARAPLEPMPRRVIATVAALIATVTIALVVVLWWAGTAGLSGAALVTARFDALRTGLSIGIGGGGVFALYLAWRRQHATEIGLVQKERDQADVARAYELQRETAEHTRQHAERVAATTERDAEARRINDLYAKSVEQLGSDKAPVRHGGLYALERLAQDHPDNPALRQSVVNVLCAYLRAPFDLPGDPPDSDADRTVRDEYRERVQEREVRLTAQRIICTHLNPGSDADNPVETFWKDTDIELTAATLIDWDMSRCLLRNTNFHCATFIGNTRFDKVVITRNSRFDKATFAGEVAFTDAKFVKNSLFNEALFTSGAEFNRVTFVTEATFDGAEFLNVAWFDGSTFTREALFSGVNFIGGAIFSDALFTEDAWFMRVTFADDTWFDGATFAKDAFFNEATFITGAQFGQAKFMKGILFNNATFRHSSPSSSRASKWPIGLQPSLDHTAIVGREGTWHRFSNAKASLDQPDDPTPGSERD